MTDMPQYLFIRAYVSIFPRLRLYFILNSIVSLAFNGS